MNAARHNFGDVQRLFDFVEATNETNLERIGRQFKISEELIKAEDTGQRVWAWFWHRPIIDGVEVAVAKEGVKAVWRLQRLYERAKGILLLMEQTSLRDESGKQLDKCGRDSTRPRGMPRDTANAIATNLYEDDPDFKHKTAKEWSEAVGCSAGTVSQLPAWKRKITETGRGRKRKGNGTAPQAVTMTDKMQECILGNGRKHEILKLLAEQEADWEPSPCDEDASDFPTKVHERKKV